MPEELHYTDKLAPHHGKHHLRTPTGQLSHEDKLKRQAFHIRVLSGIVVVLLLLVVYAATFDLDSWAEWVVFGGICSVSVGAIIALSPSRKS